MGAPRRFFRRGSGFRGSRGTGGPPRRPYQDENQVKILLRKKSIFMRNILFLIKFKTYIIY